ncbi:MAG: hypothetical protein RJB66_2715 [Pseudomonadota bacterium]|jgi:hypothetical protein
MNFEPSRAILLLFINSLIFLSAGFVWGGRLGLFTGLLLSLAWNYLLLLHKHPDAIELYNGKKLRGRDPWQILETLKSHQQTLRLKKTEIFTCHSSWPLFLISTANKNNTRILISQSLIDLLAPHELEALIVLGLVTAKNRDTFFRRILDRMALNWMTLGKLIDQFLPFRHLHLASKVSYFIAWLHLKVAYPNALQSKSDSETTQIISQTRSLASALWKIDGAMDTKTSNLPDTFQHLSILSHPVNGRNPTGFNPAIDVRLKLLVGYFPI